MSKPEFIWFAPKALLNNHTDILGIPSTRWNLYKLTLMHDRAVNRDNNTINILPIDDMKFLMDKHLLECPEYKNASEFKKLTLLDNFLCVVNSMRIVESSSWTDMDYIVWNWWKLENIPFTQHIEYVNGAKPPTSNLCYYINYLDKIKNQPHITQLTTEDKSLIMHVKNLALNYRYNFDLSCKRQISLYTGQIEQNVLMNQIKLMKFRKIL